jgi:hypothetical protein
MTMTRGWGLTAVVSLGLVAVSLGLLGQADFAVEGARAVIRFTARASFVLFCLAFSAAALYRLWPGAWTRWQRRNRRYLGVSFAASHFIHALAIIAFARLDPAQFHAGTGLGMYLLGGLGYVFIILMTATSFDATAAWLGPRAWRVLHLTGSYYISISFLTSFGMRIPVDSLYALPVAVLLAIYVLRGASWVAARSSPMIYPPLR